ncbi:transglutaminase [Paenibacillaceae bacterium]|nr:transglutaminase [Paenibacillaceae bacterium]
MRKLLALVVLLTIVIAAGVFSESEWLPVYADSQKVSNLAQLENIIAKKVQGREEEFTVTYSGDGKELSKKLPDVIKQAIAVDDYTAYIVDSYLYSIRSWSNSAKIKLTVAYRETPEQTAKVDLLVKQKVKSLIKPGMNDHQKVKAIHDWIVFNVAYDTSLKRYTAYEALIDGKAVCQGYALLTHKMLEEAGITGRIIEGTVASGDHAWNLVNLNGNWYHLDVTWDDPVPDQGKKASYGYYLKTDAQMRADHKWTRSYPKAATDYQDTLAKLIARPSEASRVPFYRNLEKQLGIVWLKPEHTVATAQQLKQRISEAVKAKEKKFTVRYLRGKQVEKDLKTAMTALSSSIASYSASYQTIGTDGAVLLEITIELR